MFKVKMILDHLSWVSGLNHCNLFKWGAATCRLETTFRRQNWTRSLGDGRQMKSRRCFAESGKGINTYVPGLQVQMVWKTYLPIQVGYPGYGSKAKIYGARILGLDSMTHHFTLLHITFKISPSRSQWRGPCHIPLVCWWLPRPWNQNKVRSYRHIPKWLHVK